MLKLSKVVMYLEVVFKFSVAICVCTVTARLRVKKNVLVIVGNGCFVLFSFSS